MLIVDNQIAIPRDEFQFEFARSGGPGGQNVNKVASKAVLRWNPAASPSLPPAVKARLLASVASRLTNLGELLITSQATRDQGRNVEDCLEKVRRLVLAAARPPKVRRPTEPTLGSRIRRVEGKTHRATTRRRRQIPESE